MVTHYLGGLGSGGSQPDTEVHCLHARALLQVICPGCVSTSNPTYPGQCRGLLALGSGIRGVRSVTVWFSFQQAQQNCTSLSGLCLQPLGRSNAQGCMKGDPERRKRRTWDLTLSPGSHQPPQKAKSAPILNKEHSLDCGCHASAV